MREPQEQYDEARKTYPSPPLPSSSSSPSLSDENEELPRLERAPPFCRNKSSKRLSKAIHVRAPLQHRLGEAAPPISQAGTAEENGVYDVSTYLEEHPGGDDVVLAATGKDATDEFEDAGHSKTARELLEKFFIGELDEMNPPMPELEVVSKKQGLKGFPQKVLEFSKQYWFAPVTVVGLSMVVGYLYLRKK